MTTASECVARYHVYSEHVLRSLRYNLARIAESAASEASCGPKVPFRAWSYKPGGCA